MDRSENVTVDSLNGWWEELPDVGGDGALSSTVRADQKFEVYYFRDEDTFGEYRDYIDRMRMEKHSTTNETTEAGATASAQPEGNPTIQKAAVPDTESEKYEVAIPGDGGRKSIDTEGSHYFVVDHSNYGTGVHVDPSQESLSAFLNLQVIDESSPL